LGKIAQNTKIGVRYLEAIELGQFGKLPGGCYDISYIRQYAKAVDYDEAELLEYYRGVTGFDSGTAPSPDAQTGHRAFWDLSLARWFR
jgi:cytoskeletal protein RodZ